MAETRTVTLGPGESGGVAFAIIPTEPRTYHVDVNGLIGSFHVLAIPAEFVVSNLIITPPTVYVGGQVTISVLVTNTGGSPGTVTITLEVT